MFRPITFQLLFRGTTLPTDCHVVYRMPSAAHSCRANRFHQLVQLVELHGHSERLSGRSKQGATPDAALTCSAADETVKTTTRSERGGPRPKALWVLCLHMTANILSEKVSTLAYGPYSAPAGQLDLSIS